MIENHFQINKTVESIIDTMRGDDAFEISSYELGLFERYDNCFDKNISNVAYNFIFEKLLKESFGFGFENEFSTNFLVKNLSCLITNTGSGKIFNSIPKLLSVEGFNNEYYCYRVTEILHKQKIKQKYLTINFGDLSEFFANENIYPEPKHDLIIVQCDNASDYYKKVDKNSVYNNLSCELYYSARSSFLLNEDGILVVLGDKKNIDSDEFKRTLFNLPIPFNLTEIKKASVVPIDNNNTFIRVFKRIK